MCPIDQASRLLVFGDASRRTSVGTGEAEVVDLGWLTHINENLEVHVGLRSLMNQAILGEGRCTVFELQDTSSRMLKRSVTEVQVHLSVAREVEYGIKSGKCSGNESGLRN